MSKVVKVVCGANEQEVAAGLSVAEVRKDQKEILNIADDADALVNGDKVDEDYILEEGDQLEFVKAAGDKG